MGNWFSREKEENTTSSSSNTTSEKDSLLTSWNVAAVATVILPLFMFMIARLVNREGGDGGGGDGEGWWNRWWGGNDQGEQRGWQWWGNGEEARQEDQGKGALAFVYIWALIVFVILVWRGNQVLGNKKDTRALFAALVVFANFTFLCWILVAGLGVQREGEAAERGWLGQFPAVMVLTFVFWTIFGIAFASLLYGKIRKNKSIFRNDYQKYEDEGGII